MKKVILLALAVTVLSCGLVEKQTDPLRYRSCVVDDKSAIGTWYSLTIKLTDSLREKVGQDYIAIEVSAREYELFNVGDTIK